MDLANEFHRLVGAAQDAWLMSRGDFRTLEPRLLDLLQFVVSHPDGRPQFVALFAELVSQIGFSRSNGVVRVATQAVEFCMRELQWPEIRFALEERRQAEKDPSVKNRLLVGVLNAYDADWHNARLYAYYARGRSPTKN